MKSTGNTNSAGELQVNRPKDTNGENRSNDKGMDPQLEALRGMIATYLLRMARDGAPPAQIRGPKALIDQVRTLDLHGIVPSELADYWEQIRSEIPHKVDENLRSVVLLSQVELTETDIFNQIFAQLQSMGLEQALDSLGVPLNQLAASPRLLQELLWYQFQLVLHEKLKSSPIIRPNELPLFRS